MLAEIIIYVALFSALFSGAFGAAFQTVDTVRYLQNQKNTIDSLDFLFARLDAFVQSNSDWQKISEDVVMPAVSGGTLPIDFVSSEIIETATSSSQVLLLTLNVATKDYTFSYVQEK